MSASIKTFLVMLLILPILLAISTQVDDDYTAPIIVVVLILGFGFKQLVASRVRFDAFLLGAVGLGYVVGNRGFAAIGPSASLPLFVGEITMVVCLIYMVGQQIIGHEKFMPRFVLSRLLLAYLVYAGIRLFFNAETYGVMAIRDSAMVYYALFFFIAYQAGQDDDSRRFFERTLTKAIILLIPTGLVTRFAPGIYDYVALRGIPIIYQKGDLVGIFCAMGAVILYCFSFRSRWPRFLNFCSAMTIALLLLLGARAGLVALLAPMAFLAIARMNRLVVYLAAILVAAVIGTLIYVQATRTEAANLEVYNLYAKYLAILDPNNEFDYESNATGMSSAQNNQFRLVWWKTVIEDTAEHSPWVGLGFGYDLTEHFMQVYYGSLVQEASEVRSPHSYFVSVFGRLGVLGLLFLLTISYYLLRGCFHAAIAVRHGHGDRHRLAMWLGALSIFVGATFGVVLEGPMGGILFWSLLGMANVYDQRALAEERHAAELEALSLPPVGQRVERPDWGRPVPAGLHHRT